jgi:anti-anti-sigma factor
MGKALTIRARREPGYVVVTVAGEVDIATVAQLRERLAALAVSGVPLVADLDQVSFIDATGLGALVGAAREAAEHGTSLHRLTVPVGPSAPTRYRATPSCGYPLPGHGKGASGDFERAS